MHKKKCFKSPTLSDRPEPAGFQILREFIIQVTDGSIQSNEITSRLRAAFTQIIEGVDVDRALQLAPAAKPRGRPPGRGAWKKWRGAAVIKYLAEHLEFEASVDGGGKVIIKHGAISAVVDQAANKFRKDRRTIERYLEEGRPLINAYARLANFSDCTTTHLTEVELDALGDVDAFDIVRMAQARRSNPNLSLDQLRELTICKAGN